MQRLKHFMGGECVEGEWKRALSDINSSDARHVIAEIPLGTAVDRSRR